MSSAFLQPLSPLLRVHRSSTTPLRRPRAHRPCRVSSCTPPSSADTPPSTPDTTILDLPLVSVSMTAGADMLFPGGTAAVKVPLSVESTLPAVGEQFGYLTISAWGDPSPVGTVSRLELIEHTDEQIELLCTGISRMRVLHMNEERTNARVELFWDQQGDSVEVQNTANKVVDAMRSIVELSIKISREEDEERQTALKETLTRVEAFCDNSQNGKKDQFSFLAAWVPNMSEQLRAEILSFIVTDLLSISYMERRNVMLATDTVGRLDVAFKCLEPYIKELAAKGAIISALGHGEEST